jgi:hypothetical protein
MTPADRDVLTSLPRTRPTRRSAKRAGTAATEPAATPEKAAAKTPAKTAANAPAKPKAKAPAAKKAAAAKAAPQPAAPSSPPPPPAGWATPRQPSGERGGGDLIGTAVQAVGELAQIGLTYGGQALRQALSRLPKP